MVAKRDQADLIEVAKRYYLLNQDQNTIASELKISKSTVSRMLSAAREKGLIEINVVDQGSVKRNKVLENSLKEQFQLANAYVSVNNVGVDNLARVSKLAAQIFVNLAPRASRIGFGWGITVQKMIESIPEINLGFERSLTPLVGGMPTVDTAPSGNNMIVALAEKSQTRAERFDAPAVVESSLTWKALLGESSVKASLKRAEETDLAFVGLGTYGLRTSELVINAMKLNPSEMKLLERQKPVGDMCGYYFNINGEGIKKPTAQRVIGLSLDKLKQIPTVVGIGAGEERLQGTIGALATGCLDILCVDEALAKALLEYNLPDPKIASSEAKGHCPNCGYDFNKDLNLSTPQGF